MSTQEALHRHWSTTPSCHLTGTMVLRVLPVCACSCLSSFSRLSTFFGSLGSLGVLVVTVSQVMHALGFAQNSFPLHPHAKATKCPDFLPPAMVPCDCLVAFLPSFFSQISSLSVKLSSRDMSVGAFNSTLTQLAEKKKHRLRKITTLKYVHMITPNHRNMWRCAGFSVAHVAKICPR